MAGAGDDLDLLLSLDEDGGEAVLETSPSSPRPADGAFTPPRIVRRGGTDMSVFREAVKDYLEATPASTTSAVPKRPKYGFVRISAIKNLAGSDSFSGCWATAGVVLDKGVTRVSAQGKDYSIWKMGALDESEVSVFLFGDAHAHYSGAAVGAVFALFNGNLRMDNGRLGGSKREYRLHWLSLREAFEMEDPLPPLLEEDKEEFRSYQEVSKQLVPGQRESVDMETRQANGLQAYAVTLVTYLSLWWFGIFNPAIVYDHLGEIYSALVFGSFVFCIFLYIKGHVAPSSSDSGSSGNVIIDFYWGMELYPRIGKHFDIKVFTNCRFGMMSWAVLAVTYCIKQYEMNGRITDSMLVNTALMLIYVTKFFWWESGYWCTMDIAHDRAGFYICWGCLVWVPSIYTSPGMYLVNHPVNLGPQLALSILLAGILCIYINYDCDRQRQEFRRTNGKCSIWGKAPSKIVASYQTTNGETKSSLLLTSGWWGLSRHFHYVPEILAAFFWTIPALFNHFLPYFYVIFLTILLFDRAKRDDDRCSSKYGKYWKMYCNRVPYRIVPGIY